MDERVKFGHHKYLQQIADEDVQFVLKKDVSYGASWRWSGGANAWAMVRRKIDRLMEMLRPLNENEKSRLRTLATMIENPGYTITNENDLAGFLCRVANVEDVFQALRNAPGGDDGTVLAEIRDLRRYLLLLEAGMMDDLKMPVVDKPSPWFPQTIIMTADASKESPRPVGVSIIDDSSRHAVQGCYNFRAEASDPEDCMNCNLPREMHRCNCDASYGENRYHKYGRPGCRYHQ